MDRLPAEGEIVLAWWGDDAAFARADIKREGWVAKHGQWWVHVKPPDSWVSLAQAKAAPQMATAGQAVLDNTISLGGWGTVSGHQLDRGGKLAAALRSAGLVDSAVPKPDVTAIIQVAAQEIDDLFTEASNGTGSRHFNVENIATIIREAIQRTDKPGTNPKGTQ
jgi:hypothetical protein